MAASLIFAGAFLNLASIILRQLSYKRMKAFIAYDPGASKMKTSITAMRWEELEQYPALDHAVCTKRS